LQVPDEFPNCRGHSTETAFLKVHSDTAEALVIDVIDHPILQKRLEFSFRIKEKSFNLSDRTQYVSVADKPSPDVGLRFGVLGSKNYCMYTKPVGETIKACIADISTWMYSNMLKLNKDKIEFIVFLF